MKNVFRRVGGGKLRLGKFALPVWTIALGAIVMALAAGQAVGPVLSGSIQGSTAVTAQQAIVLSSTLGDSVATSTVSHTTATTEADNGLVSVNDEGTNFTAVFEMHVGDTGEQLRLAIRNESNDNASAILTLTIPAGIDVKVDPETGTTLKEARMSANTWLLQVNTGNTEYLKITIEPKDDVQPGLFTVTGRIVQYGG
jgi:hypothetical protein